MHSYSDVNVTGIIMSCWAISTLRKVADDIYKIKVVRMLVWHISCLSTLSDGLVEAVLSQGAVFTTRGLDIRPSMMASWKASYILGVPYRKTQDKGARRCCWH